MPLVGKDWTQSGVAGLFSAIKVCPVFLTDKIFLCISPVSFLGPVWMIHKLHYEFAFFGG